MEDERWKVFKRPVPQNEKEFRTEPVFELSLYEIMKAFREIMSEFDSQDVSEIKPEEFTIEEKIDAIRVHLQQQGPVAFRDLFGTVSSRLEVIVTFIALLELIKRSEVKGRQGGAFGEIWIYAVEEREQRETDLEQPPASG